MPDTPLPRGPSAQRGLLFLAQSSLQPLLGSLLSNKSRSISGLAFSYPNLEQTMSHPAPSRTLTGRKPERQIFRLQITLRNPDRTAAELAPHSQPFVAVTRDSFFSEDGEGEEGGDREGAESSSNTQENTR